MNYLITLKPLKHDSNEGCYSVLAELDSTTNTIIRKLLIPSANSTTSNGCIRSFSQGVQKVDDLIYVSGYNFILVVNYDSFTIIDSFSHPLMSDIHCIEVFEENIYAVSTTIDALLCFDKKTKALKWHWRAEDSNLQNKIGLNWRFSKLRMKSSIFGKYFEKLGLNKRFKIQFIKFDFRGIGKSNSPYHSSHLNELRVIDSKTILLGTKGWEDKGLKKSSLIELSMVDMSAKFIAAPGSFIGSHDILNCGNTVIVTESINESISSLDMISKKISRFQLNKRGYFIRGIAKTSEGYLVGFSPNRNLLDSLNFKNKDRKNALIEYYNNDFTKVISEIELNNFYPDSTGCAVHNIVACD